MRLQELLGNGRFKECRGCGVDVMLDVSEGIEMLCEVADRLEAERKRQGVRKLPTGQKRALSGRVTKNVIREHLLRRGLNVSNVDVHIKGLPRLKTISLLLLKKRVKPTADEYEPKDIDTVLQIHNIIVDFRARLTKDKFDAVKNIAKGLRFACVVLIEYLGYPHEVMEESLQEKVFTLTLVDRYKTVAESRSQILSKYKKGAIKESGHWKELIDFLSRKSLE